VELLPVEEKFGLRSQMCRAVVSIPSNIAEGCARGSESDYKRFLEMALGSSFELETQLLLTRELNLAPNDTVDNLMSSLTQEQKMINSLITKIVMHRHPKANGQSPRANGIIHRQS